MPVRHFSTGGNVSSAADVASSPLIPGVEPGGSRAGKVKPALLIRDAWAHLTVLGDTGTTAETQHGRVNLKLSQEVGLDPGLLLPIEEFVAAKTGTASVYNSIQTRNVFKAQGTIWAPRAVGVRLEPSLLGSPTAVNWNVWLDYDVVMVPWMDWFIMWEFLDNVVNNETDY